ncbi:response regulator [Flavobacterium sp. K5-23]|uniref:response regulator n=1 Tax=Flavobacterium sp. K5-23 TaxID=2746225 RepID=UPI00200E6E19|nr:response regulator [Flavobacterium sp. K5-23]UQD56688.1 response regulator [Flavobacterium sp. K5-23]
MKKKLYNNPILLVEDSPVDVDLTLRAFKTKNLTNPIQVARDGEEALSYIQKWDEGELIPVVILLDLKLPKVDGLEVLRIFKSHEHYKAIPIVVLTSSLESTDLERAYKFGVNSYIVKPVNFDNFIEVASQIELYWSVLNKPLIKNEL